jgi:Fe-S cluster assembly scaffold protein SufB
MYGSDRRVFPQQVFAVRSHQPAGRGGSSMNTSNFIAQICESIQVDPMHVFGDDVARVEVHENKVVGVHLAPGLKVEADETKDGINAYISVAEGAEISKPIHICFGVLPETGLQYINLNIGIKQNSKASILAHCTFPNARKVEHRMDATITIEPGARYSHFERHVHVPYGGVNVIPNALSDTARAEIYNTMTASAPRARGHVDCKEIVVGKAFAKAVPVVEVNHPLAHITHEAAIGSVDSKQLQTLLTRGLSEEEATDIIIEGLLSKKPSSVRA